MDLADPAAIALHNSKHETIEELEFIPEHGRNKKESDAKLPGIMF
jgi:hypothetical protein